MVFLNSWRVKVRTPGPILRKFQYCTLIQSRCHQWRHPVTSLNSYVFYIEHNDNIQGVPQKVNPFKSALTYCSNSLMRHKWQPPRLFPSTPAFLDMKILNIGIVTGTWHIFGQSLFLPLLILLTLLISLLMLLEFSTLYFIYFAPSAHLIQSWNLFQISNFNTAHFCIQYCTLFIQYCTKCAILHTKIGPVRQRDAIFRFSLTDNVDPSLNFPNI